MTESSARGRGSVAAALLVGAAWLLLGCAPLAPEPRLLAATLTPATPAPASEPAKLDAVVLAMAAAATEPRAGQRQRLEMLEREHSARGDVATRLELAWLLSRPGTGFEDSRRASELLEEYLATPGSDPAHRALAEVLQALLIERGKAQGVAARAREQTAEDAEELASLQLQVSTLQGLLETKRQQLEALRDIETSINERKSPEPELLPDDEQSANPASR